VIAAFLLVLAIVLIVEAFRAWGGQVMPDTDDDTPAASLEGGRAC